MISKTTTKLIRVEDIAAKLGISLSSAYRLVRKHKPLLENGRFKLTPDCLKKIANDFRLEAARRPNLSATKAVLAAVEEVMAAKEASCITHCGERITTIDVPGGYALFRIDVTGKGSVAAATKEISNEVFATHEEALAKLALHQLSEVGSDLIDPEFSLMAPEYPAGPDSVSDSYSHLRQLVTLAITSYVGELAPRISWRKA